MKNLQNIINNLSSRVDLKNPRTITLIAAAVIIIFAILYVYQSRRLLEGFESYYVTGANDTVTLGSLDKVKVGAAGLGLMDAITQDNTFNTEVERKITESAGFNDFVKFQDLTDNLNTYTKFSDLNNTITTSLVNYLKKTDIANSSELKELIDSKISTYDTQVRAYVNTQVQQTIPNINARIENIANSISGTPKLVGTVNITNRFDASDGYSNCENNSYFILGKKIITDNNNLLKLPISAFSNSILNNYHFGDSNQWYMTPRLHILCLFDWKNDFNIFYIKTKNDISSRYYDNYPGYYNSVYPLPLNYDGQSKLTSPFPRTNIKTNTTYFVKCSSNPYMSDGNVYLLYYILFNNTPENPSYEVKYVTYHYTGYNWNQSTYEFVFKTSNNTFNFGIYVVSMSGSWNGVSSIGCSWPSSSGVTIYEIQTAEQILAVPTTTLPNTTTTRASSP